MLPPHPNIVLFRGVALPPDPICIVTDFYHNGSLLHYLQENKGHVSFERMIELAEDIAKGMVR